jgi:rare lipoprotein A
MGQGRGHTSWRLCCVGAVAFACVALAACSANPYGTTSRYSKRVIEDGEPIPKGGGIYKVGQPYTENGRTYRPAENPGYRADGMASWYGPDFHGRATANGEIYDMHAITAAHTTLPIPSYARVTNLDNGRSIIVRVNDRGPYYGGRVIDVSIGAAKALDFYKKGLARVRVEYVGRAPLEGTDDALLMATLRDGSPAPAPSLVKVAMDKPPLPPERPFALGGGANRPAERAAMAEAAFAEARPAAGSTSSQRSGSVQSVASTSSGAVASAASFAPRSGEGAYFISGRGLY